MCNLNGGIEGGRYHIEWRSRLEHRIRIGDADIEDGEKPVLRVAHGALGACAARLGAGQLGFGLQD